MAILVLFRKVKTVKASIKRSAIDKTDGNYFNLLVQTVGLYTKCWFTVRFFFAKQLYLRKAFVEIDLAILCFVIFPGSKKLFPSFNFFCKCCCVARLAVLTEVGL